MAEWAKSTLYILGGYALFQYFLYFFVFTSHIAPPQRGESAPVCATSSFAAQGATERIARFDTSPLVIGGNAYTQAPNHGEDVYRHLSLLRESTRDGWVYFGGDQSLKQTYFQTVSVMSRSGLDAPQPVQTMKKRHKNRLESKTETRIGSARVSYKYALSLAELQSDFKKVSKEINPPAVIVYSVGSYDLYNRSDVSIVELTRTASVLIDSIRDYISGRMNSFQARIPVVLLLAPPALAATASTTTVSSSQVDNVERHASFVNALQQSVSAASTSLAQLSASLSQQLNSHDHVGAAAIMPKSYLAFADANTIALPLHGALPVFKDDTILSHETVELLTNPVHTSASLAAFITCTIGQPSWGLRAFTPGQIALGIFFAVIVAWWCFSLVKSKFLSPTSSRGGGYHRVAASDAVEIELGNAGIQSTNKADGSAKLSPPPPGATTSLTSKAVVDNDAVLTNPNLPASVAFWNYFQTTAWQNSMSAFVQLAAILLFMFLLDGNQRVSWWFIGDKTYIRDTFLFLLVAIFLLAWRSTSPTTDGTDAILNREQTEEWKGWMQILFVLYHFFAAKEMYNLIRIFIAAYVWMTGYGNFFFFYKTNDYSFARLSKLLFRLNFFVAFVCIALNREYMQYYVCALHTFYFLTVYAMMGICWHWNKNDRLLGVKFMALFLILFLLFDVPQLGIFNFIFKPFSLFYWNNSMWEWWFRSGLDHYATFFGMLCAWNLKRMEEFLNKIEMINQSKKKIVTQLIVSGTLVGLGLLWMVYCLWLPKNDYNKQHAYTSIIPIVLYIILRNFTPFLRKYVAHLFTWFGKITLETYILQFHIWLSDDAGTIVTYFPNYPMMNFIFSTAIYVSLSVVMFQLTNVLSDALIPKNCTTKELLFKIFLIVAAWLTLYNTVYFFIQSGVPTV